jgi:UrcA family protein
MHISIWTFAAVAMLATLGFGAHADASSPDPIIRGRSIVHYGDLNIDSENDAKILLQRIEQAAKDACGGHPAFNTYTRTPDPTFEECRSGTIARTVKRLGAPTVTRIYAEANRSVHGGRTAGRAAYP